MAGRPKEFVNAGGERLRLGAELGRGGEGSVFSVQGSPELVAKVYHRPPDRGHQQKLLTMVGQTDHKLKQYVAWPQYTLHERAGGPVLGFVMPKMGDRDAIHSVYSPAHRKREKPSRKWDFLLLAARNTAAAVETVHERGYVIGDLNQNGVLISDHGRAALIDSDSFQIRTNGHVFRCRVGVPEFTPPELQGLASFDSIDRTANHDNFGLAVLIFQLLLGGRHPFSGVPQRSDVGNDMGEDIRAFRYADSVDKAKRGLAPPPKSVPISILSADLVDMFTRAFTEPGARGMRPSARDWVLGLDGLIASLRTCAKHSLHMYSRGAGSCPWCALDVQGVSYFAGTMPAYQPSALPAKLDIKKMWREVERVKPPAVPNAPTASTLGCTGEPRPPGVPSKSVLRAARWLTVITGMVLSVALSSLWVLFVGVSLVTLAIIAGVARPLTAERAKRQAALDEAKNVFERLTQQYEASDEPFRNLKLGLLNMHTEWSTLDVKENADLRKLQASAHERALARHLQGCFIDRASIPGVGPAKTTALRSFGIETAADVDRYRVLQVRGFGEQLTQRMLAWRTQCERRFRFNPGDPSLKADEARLRNHYAARRAEIYRGLHAGPQRLEREARGSEQRARSLYPVLTQAAKDYGQAQADRSVVG
jgi:DNA-binding helix-hairpin-helix protein with protein kinase domain